MKTAKRLRQFRERCEREAGTHASQIEVPLLSVLTDVCKALQLSPKDRQHVLGQRGMGTLTHRRVWTVAERSNRWQ